MKILKKIVIICGMLVVSVCQVSPIMAMPILHDETISVPVSYVPDIQYTLKVDVRGQGKVLDGSQSIENGLVQYEFLSPDQKQFIILPNIGYQLKRISYESAGMQPEDLMNQIVSNVITIDIEDREATLYVEFMKTSLPPEEDAIAPDLGGSGGSSSRPNDTVDTVDSTKVWDEWVMISTVIFMVGILKKSKKDAYNG